MDAPARTALYGRRVLVVEDEFLVALELEELVADCGCTVLGPLRSVAEALAFFDSDTPDAALLDLNLDGVPSTPIAAALRARSVPFLLITGYSARHGATPLLADAPRLAKPVVARELERELANLLGA